jgi:hypothetical protein
MKINYYRSDLLGNSNHESEARMMHCDVSSIFFNNMPSPSGSAPFWTAGTYQSHCEEKVCEGPWLGDDCRGMLESPDIDEP